VLCHNYCQALLYVLTTMDQNITHWHWNH